MEKLVERESAPRSPLIAGPALAVQFFLIPLAVVAVIGVVYLGCLSMGAATRGPSEALPEVTDGGAAPPRPWGPRGRAVRPGTGAWDILGGAGRECLRLSRVGEVVAAMS